MLPLEVVFGNIHRDAAIGQFRQAGGTDKAGAEGEPGDVLKNVGVFDGFRSGPSPGKGRMSGDKDAGNGNGVEILGPEAPDNDDSRGMDVAA